MIMETKKFNNKRVLTIEHAQDVLRCTKFHLNSETESANLQKKLLEIGCNWQGENKEVHNEECKYLFVSVNLNITTTNSEEIFIKNKFTELQVNDVLNIEIKENDMEKVMTKEEVFDYLKDTKIMCTSDEEAIIVQEKLFALGFSYYEFGIEIIEFVYLFYIDEKGKISYGSDFSKWLNDNAQEIKLNEILSIKIKKEEKPKFDLKTLKPFQKVLVRNEKGCIWFARFYDFNERELGEGERFVTTSGGIYNKCIPYNEDTKHLHGTTEEEPEFYRSCK